jgi:hypothetical protein
MIEFDPFMVNKTQSTNTDNGNTNYVIGVLGIVAIIAVYVIYRQSIIEKGKDVELN